MSWKDDEEYLRGQGMSDEQIAEIRRAYFDEVVSQDPDFGKFPPVQRDALKNVFYGQQAKAQPGSAGERLIEATVPLGAAIVSKFNERLFENAAGVAGAVGRAGNALGGDGEIPNKWEATYRAAAERARNNPDAYRSGEKMLAGDLAVGAAGLIPDVAGITAASRAVGPVAGMGAWSGLQSYGNDAPAKDVAKEAAKGALMGKFFEMLHPIGNAAASLVPDAYKTAAAKAAELVAQTAGGGTVATLGGATPEEALKEGLVIGAASLAGGARTGKALARVGGKEVFLDVPVEGVGKFKGVNELATTDRALSTPQPLVEDRVKKLLLDDAASQGADLSTPEGERIVRGAESIGNKVSEARNPAELFFSLTNSGVPRSDAAKLTVEYWSKFKTGDESLPYFEGMQNKRPESQTTAESLGREAAPEQPPAEPVPEPSAQAVSNVRQNAADISGMTTGEIAKLRGRQNLFSVVDGIGDPGLQLRIAEKLLNKGEFSGWKRAKREAVVAPISNEPPTLSTNRPDIVNESSPIANGPSPAVSDIPIYTTKTVPIDSLSFNPDAVAVAKKNTRAGRGSKTKGPIDVWIDPASGKMAVLDGGHRVAEAVARGEAAIEIRSVPAPGESPNWLREVRTKASQLGFSTPKEITNAEAIRGNEGQVYPAGAEPGSGPGEGGKDLQLAPPEVSAAATLPAQEVAGVPTERLQLNPKVATPLEQNAPTEEPPNPAADAIRDMKRGKGPLSEDDSVTGEEPMPVGGNESAAPAAVRSASALGDPALKKIFDQLPEQRRRELISSATGVDPNSIPRAAVDEFKNAVTYSDMKGSSTKLRSPLRVEAQRKIDEGGTTVGGYIPGAEFILPDEKKTGEQKRSEDAESPAMALARAMALVGQQKENRGEAVRAGGYKYIPVEDGSVMVKRSGKDGTWVRHESPESMVEFISNPENFNSMKHQANSVAKHVAIAERVWGTYAANDIYANARGLPPEVIADLPPASPTFTIESIGNKNTKRNIGDSALISQKTIIGKLGRLGEMMTLGADRVTDRKNEIASRYARGFEKAAEVGGRHAITEGENLNIVKALQGENVQLTEREAAIVKEVRRGYESLYSDLSAAGAPKMAEYLRDYYTHSIRPEILQDILLNKANSKWAKEMVKETARRRGLSEEDATARVNKFIEQNLLGFESIQKAIDAGNIKKLEYAPAHKVREWVDMPVSMIDTDVREVYRRYSSEMGREIAWYENMKYLGDPADKLFRVYPEGSIQRRQVVDYIKQIKGRDFQQEGIIDSLAKKVSPIRSLILTGKAPIDNLLGGVVTGAQINGFRNTVKGFFFKGITGNKIERDPGVSDAGISAQKVSGTEFLNVLRKNHPFPKSEMILRSGLYEGSLYHLRDLAKRAREDRVSMEMLARYSAEPLKLIEQMEKFAEGKPYGKTIAGVPEEAFYYAANKARAGAMAMEGYSQPRAWTTDPALRNVTTFKRFAYQKMIFDFNMVKQELVSAAKAKAEGGDLDATRFYGRAAKRAAMSAVLHPLIGTASNLIWKTITGQYDKSIVAKISKIDDDSKNNIVQAGLLYVEASMNAALGGILLSSLYDLGTAVNVKRIKNKDNPKGNISVSLGPANQRPENILLGFNITKTGDMIRQAGRILSAAYGIPTGKAGAVRDFAREIYGATEAIVPGLKIGEGISEAVSNRKIAENIDADSQVNTARRSIRAASESGNIKEFAASSRDLREGVRRSIKQAQADGDTEKAKRLTEYYADGLDTYLTTSREKLLEFRRRR